jgi:uncharacterized protein
MSAETVVRDLYAKVAASDFKGLLSLLADDCEFVQAESLPFGGIYRGHAGFLKMAEQIGIAWPNFGVQPLAFLGGGGDQVVVRTVLTGKGLQMDMLELWQVRGSKIIRCQPFYFDAAAAAQSAKENLQ